MSFLIFYFVTEGQILHWAVGNGYTNFSKMLLQCGVYVDFPGLLKETPLHLAAKNGFRDLVDVLVQSGGNVNARNFPIQETPLHLAARSGHQHIAQFLILQGSQVNALNVPFRETPLHLASRNGHQQIAELLIQHGSQVNARNAFWQETPLHLASRNGHQQIAELLIRHGGLVNAQGCPWQETPLHLASRNGHQQTARVLIQRGGQVNAINTSWKETPLHLAANDGHQHIAEFLIQQGGQVNAINTPWKETPLHLAARDGHRHIAEILVKHGSQVDTRNLIQETPLHVAVQNGHQQTAELLIHDGGDVNAQKDPKESPTHLAAGNGHPSIIHLLIQCGGLVDARNDPLQGTPLHFAAMNGQRLVAEVLIQHGANYKARNKKKQVPLHMDAQNGHKDVAENFKYKEGYRQKHIADAGGGSDATAIIRYISFQHRDQNIETPSYFTAQNKEKHVAELLTQYGIVSTVQNEESVPPSWSSICSHGNVRVLIDHKRNGILTSQSQSLHLALKRDRKQSPVLIQHGRNATAQNPFALNSLLLLAPKNSGSRYLCHQTCAPCQDFPTQITLCNVAFGSLSGLLWCSDKFGVTGEYGNDSINGVNANAFAEPATILWFAALCTVSVMMLVLLSWWKCHRREHNLRLLSTLTLRENSSQPKTKELLQPLSHCKQVKESAVIGALHEGCAHYKSTMKKMSRRSAPTFCNDLGMLASAERMERVRTWLECNHGQEEMPSLDSEGNYVVNNPALVTG